MNRDVHSPGWKYAEWEMRGVPLRLEIGPKDIEKSQVMLVRRDTREKLPTPVDGLADRVGELLRTIQADLLDRARRFTAEHTTQVSSRQEFDRLLEGRPGFVIAPWCGRAVCEAAIKTATQATIRNIALEPLVPSAACIECGQPGQTDVYFAKSY